MLAPRESYKRGNAGSYQREERMKSFRNLAIALVVSALLRSFGATDLDKLSVLYIGEPDSPPPSRIERNHNTRDALRAVRW